MGEYVAGSFSPMELKEGLTCQYVKESIKTLMNTTTKPGGNVVTIMSKLCWAQERNF